MSKIKKIIVAGSIVLDVTMMLDASGNIKPDELFREGKVSYIDGVSMYLGGITGNTGIGLHKMGIPVQIHSKVGGDRSGKVILEILKDQGVDAKVAVFPEKNTSVGIAMTPPGMDKISFFCRGASQMFTPEDISSESLQQADLFHFGYPSAMRNMFLNDGDEFLRLLKKAKETGITTSIDMAMPALNSEAGQVDWSKILERVLPYIDVYVPSIEETLFMLDRKKYLKFAEECGKKNIIDYLDENEIPKIGERLVELGAKIVLLKIGKKGLYLRTAAKEAFTSFGRALPQPLDAWAGRELWKPALDTNPVISTTGAGDTAIAGFLASLLCSYTPEKALQIASLTASLCIGGLDTVGRLRPIKELDAMLEEHCKILPVDLQDSSWIWNPQADVFNRS